MFHPRKIESQPSWLDPDGIKIYTISTQGQPVDQTAYLPQLAELKRRKSVAWTHVPAFVIFHDGAAARYLVLSWWGNDNELFTAVSVQTASGWMEDPAKYSFCVYDLEVMWWERGHFVRCIDCAAPNLDDYRSRRLDDP